MITIYTDGACIGNPGPGGWGAVISGDGPKRSLHGRDPDTTNNRMEILAVIKGLEDLPENSDITVYSDSSYVINTMTKNWKRNKNQDLWETLDEEVGKRNVQWVWVKGHAGDPLNEEADHLAHSEAVGKAVSSAGDKTPNLVGGPVMGQQEEKDSPGKADRLTHVDEHGEARMVDVGGKPDTDRVAVAKGFVKMEAQTIELVNANGFEKGDVLAVARVAGVMAAKQTSNLIPLCHPLPLTQVTIDFDIDIETSTILITGISKTRGKTGVEMEALTAVTVAALTVYDMCKSVDRGMSIGARLSSKTGGQSGDVFLD